MSDMRRDYEQKPGNIEDRSFGLIREAISCYAADERLMDVIVRVVHAGGDFSLANLIEAHNDALEAAGAAFSRGGKIFCDVEMLKSGISRKECARLGLTPVCYIHDEEIAADAKRRGVTRAIASLDRAVGEGIRIFAFGNAPTALFRLLEHASGGAPVDLAVGMPVGFVGAADSKADLAATAIPSVILRGPRGGSGLCAACVNALLRKV